MAANFSNLNFLLRWRKFAAIKQKLFYVDHSIWPILCILILVHWLLLLNHIQKIFELFRTEVDNQFNQVLKLIFMQLHKLRSIFCSYLIWRKSSMASCPPALIIAADYILVSHSLGYPSCFAAFYVTELLSPYHTVRELRSLSNSSPLLGVILKPHLDSIAFICAYNHFCVSFIYIQRHILYCILFF